MLDANILMRAVLGKGPGRSWLSGAISSNSLRRNSRSKKRQNGCLPQFKSGKLPQDPFMDYFGSLRAVVQEIELATYSSFESTAQQRLFRRDEDDWPILATSFALECPI